MQKYSYNQYIPCTPIYNGNDYQRMIPGRNETNVRNRKRIYLGYLERNDNGRIVELSGLTSYGDYNNTCMVERSNYETVKEYFKENKVRYFDVYGGYGYNGIYVNIEDYESNEVVIEVIEALEDYPLFDDNHYSELTWNSYFEEFSTRDFAYSLKQEFNLSDITEDRIESMDSERLMSFFESLLPSGEFFRDENPNSVYILYDYAAKNCTRGKLASFLYDKEHRAELPIVTAEGKAHMLQMGMLLPPQI